MSEERKRNLRTQGRFSGSKNGANNISPGANSGASPTFCDVKSRLSLSPQSTCVNSENTPELVYKKSNWVPVQQELMECKTFQKHQITNLEMSLKIYEKDQAVEYLESYGIWSAARIVDDEGGAEVKLSFPQFGKRYTSLYPKENVRNIIEERTVDKGLRAALKNKKRGATILYLDDGKYKSGIIEINDIRDGTIILKDEIKIPYEAIKVHVPGRASISGKDFGPAENKRKTPPIIGISESPKERLTEASSFDAMPDTISEFTVAEKGKLFAILNVLQEGLHLNNAIVSGIDTLNQTIREIGQNICGAIELMHKDVMLEMERAQQNQNTPASIGKQSDDREKPSMFADPDDLCSSQPDYSLSTEPHISVQCDVSTGQPDVPLAFVPNVKIEDDSEIIISTNSEDSCLLQRERQDEEPMSLDDEKILLPQNENIPLTLDREITEQSLLQCEGMAAVSEELVLLPHNQKVLLSEEAKLPPVYSGRIKLLPSKTGNSLTCPLPSPLVEQLIALSPNAASLAKLAMYQLFTVEEMMHGTCSKRNVRPNIKPLEIRKLQYIRLLVEKTYPPSAGQADKQWKIITKTLNRSIKYYTREKHEPKKKNSANLVGLSSYSTF